MSSLRSESLTARHFKRPVALKVLENWALSCYLLVRFSTMFTYMMRINLPSNRWKFLTSFEVSCPVELYRLADLTKSPHKAASRLTDLTSLPVIHWIRIQITEKSSRAKCPLSNYTLIHKLHLVPYRIHSFESKLFIHNCWFLSFKF